MPVSGTELRAISARGLQFAQLDDAPLAKWLCLVVLRRAPLWVVGPHPSPLARTSAVLRVYSVHQVEPFLSGSADHHQPRADAARNVGNFCYFVLAPPSPPETPAGFATAPAPLGPAGKHATKYLKGTILPLEKVSATAISSSRNQNVCPL